MSYTRKQVRTEYCRACGATPGHPCVEYRNYGKHGKYVGHTREANHAERIEEYKNNKDDAIARSTDFIGLSGK